MTSLQLASNPLSATHAVPPKLGFGMDFADLYRREGLVKLDQAFLEFLREGEEGLRVRLDHARAHRIIDHNHGETANGYALSLQLMKLGNALFQRTSRQ